MKVLICLMLIVAICGVTAALVKLIVTAFGLILGLVLLTMLLSIAAE